MDISPSNYKFFWRSDPDPFSDLQNAMWTPYDEGDCQFLENHYQIQSPEVFLGEPPKYKVIFKKMMQINLKETWRQRPIRREIPSNVQNIIRFNRFDADGLNKIQPEIDFFENDNLCQFKTQSRYIRTGLFIMHNNVVNIWILKKFDWFPKIPPNFKDFLLSLIEEIKNLSQISKYQNSQNGYKYEYELKGITELNFFEKILKIYTFESFLYREINQILRNSLTKEFQNIKYYYVSLIASVSFYSQNSFKVMERKKIISPNDKVLLLYRGGGISENEIETYEKCKYTCIVRQIFEFMSTSLQRNKAELCMRNSKSKMKALYEIEVPIKQKSEENCIIYLGEVSDFPTEEECLIKSGSLLKVEEIKRKENGEVPIWSVKLRLLSSGWKGCDYFVRDCKEELFLGNNNLGNIDYEDMEELCSAIEKSQTLKILDLRINGLGTMKTENMELLMKALIKNKIITSINFRGNSFGSGKTENMEMLMKALIQNETIKVINLEYNDFGTGNTKNMEILLKVLSKNKTITSLDLSLNEFGSGKPENMELLMVALSKNEVITSLNLYSNNFGSGKTENMEFLMKALSKNQT